MMLLLGVTVLLEVALLSTTGHCTIQIDVDPGHGLTMKAAGQESNRVARWTWRCKELSESPTYPRFAYNRARLRDRNCIQLYW